MTRHFLVIGAQRCGTTVLARPARGASRHRDEPARTPGAQGVHVRRAGRAWSGLVPLDLLRARHHRDAARREEHELHRGPGGCRPGAPRCSARPSHRAAPRPRRSGRSPTGASAPSTGTRTGRSTRLCARTCSAAVRDPGETSVSPFAYLERGRYTAYLQPWMTAFPQRHSTCGSWRTCSPSSRRSPDLYAHLGVDAGVRPGLRGQRINESSERSAGARPSASSRSLRDYFAGSDESLREAARRAGAVAEPELTADNRCLMPDIPFNRAAIEGNELAYIRAAIESGHTSSSGEFSVKVGRGALRVEMGAEDVLLTTSCTSALELSALLLDLQPGDTVVVPSFTFTTTALAFARSGRRLLFCDIEPRTLGIDPEHLETLLDDTVRAVVPVHYAGVACDVDGIRKVLVGPARRAVIEDNAHGLFGRWRRPAARQPRPVRHPELPRHEEHHLRRGRRAGRQRRARRRPGPSALRQGHQPAGVLPRPGRQVLVEGHRLVVRAVGHARGATSGRQLECRDVDPAQATRRLRALRGDARPASPTGSA